MTGQQPTTFNIYSDTEKQYEQELKRLNDADITINNKQLITIPY